MGYYPTFWILLFVDPKKDVPKNVVPKNDVSKNDVSKNDSKNDPKNCPFSKPKPQQKH